MLKKLKIDVNEIKAIVQYSNIIKAKKLDCVILLNNFTIINIVL